MNLFGIFIDHGLCTMKLCARLLKFSARYRNYRTLVHIPEAVIFIARIRTRRTWRTSCIYAVFWLCLPVVCYVAILPHCTV